MVNIKICIYFNDLNSHYNLNFVEKTVNLNKYTLILCLEKFSHGGMAKHLEPDY